MEKHNLVTSSPSRAELNPQGPSSKSQGATHDASARAALAAQILALHVEVEKYRDATIAYGRVTCEKAIACGELLLQAQKELGRDYEDFLQAYCNERENFSRRTAYNYMRVVRFKQELANDLPEFRSLADMYVACGILPKPGESEKPERPAPVFRIKFDVNGPGPEQWSAGDRREFLEKAKPIVDYYERAKAVELTFAGPGTKL